MCRGVPFSIDSQSNPVLSSSFLLVSPLFPGGFVLLWGSQLRLPTGTGSLKTLSRARVRIMTKHSKTLTYSSLMDLFSLGNVPPVNFESGRSHWEFYT